MTANDQEALRGVRKRQDLTGILEKHDPLRLIGLGYALIEGSRPQARVCLSGSAITAVIPGPAAAARVAPAGAARDSDDSGPSR